MIEIAGLIVLGLVAGMFAASLGIGGGIIFVPVLVSAFGFSQLDAQGTSLAVIVPTAIIATIGHMRANRVVWKVALFTGTAGIIGALLGSQVAYLVDEAFLRRVFAVVLAGLAVRMALRAWRIRPNRSVDGA
ncbi:MAG TPA: sulfite exporter TauE/SafE family protein [Acidimicrobiia bacterium]|nr:sulfite exporter TauE/SafE family protein [Acidimicrobiia bacterium]